MADKELVILEGTDGYKHNLSVRIEDMLLCTAHDIKRAIEDYKWVEGDVLICSYAKCGTHLIWEITQMIVNNTAQLQEMSKAGTMMEFIPITDCSKYVKSPRALNTHIRLDCLPAEFQNRKTICVIRNPKDARISLMYHSSQIFRISALTNPDSPQPDCSLEGMVNSGLSESPVRESYWTFHSYMWKRRHEPHILVLFYEDLVMDPLAEIKKIDEFLGTKRSSELLEKISEATRFDKMKVGKEKSERIAEQLIFNQEHCDAIKTHKVPIQLFRKGKIGDWKKHLTVSQNERFDKFISEWKLKNGLDDLHFTFE